MRRNKIFFLVALLLLIIPITYAIEITSISSTQDTTTRSAPDFSSVDIVTNTKISLDQFKGTIVLLNFVNYGCNQGTNQIVSQQLFAIQSLIKQRNDFVPVSVFCGCCPADTLRAFATENDFSWSWILDSGNSIIPNYKTYINTYGYPTLVFINKNQEIVDVSGFLDTTALSARLDTI